jgi:hypothetical protein
VVPAHVREQQQQQFSAAASTAPPSSENEKPVTPAAASTRDDTALGQAQAHVQARGRGAGRPLPSFGPRSHSHTLLSALGPLVPRVEIVSPKAAALVRAPVMNIELHTHYHESLSQLGGKTVASLNGHDLPIPAADARVTITLPGLPNGRHRIVAAVVDASMMRIGDEQVVLFEFEVHEPTHNGIPLGDFADWADEPVDPDYALALEASIEADRELREMQDREYEQSLLADAAAAAAAAAASVDGEDAEGDGEWEWLCGNCHRANPARARNCAVCLVARPEGRCARPEPATAAATTSGESGTATATARAEIVTLPDEPDASDEDAVADVIVHLPSSAHAAGRVRRRFAGSAALHWVFMLVQNEGADLASVRLATRFPRRTFDFATHAELSVAEAGLCPSAILFTELA